MKKALEATQQEFESSSGRTPEYLAWHRLFKREFTKFLTSKGATKIEIGKPNHFDMSGFFTLGSSIWYFSIGDLRGFKDTMLIRTATSYKDYTGGQNQYVPLAQSEEYFIQKFDELMARHEKVHGLQKDTGNIVDEVNAATMRYAQAVGPIVNTSVNAAPPLNFG